MLFASFWWLADWGVFDSPRLSLTRLWLTRTALQRRITCLGLECTSVWATSLPKRCVMSSFAVEEILSVGCRLCLRSSRLFSSSRMSVVRLALQANCARAYLFLVVSLVCLKAIVSQVHTKFVWDQADDVSQCQGHGLSLARFDGDPGTCVFMCTLLSD